MRAIDPWPHSEAGRFHRGISLLVTPVASLILAAEVLRNHAPLELAVLGATLVVVALAAWRLHAAFRASPANFPSRVAAPADKPHPTSPTLQATRRVRRHGGEHEHRLEKARVRWVRAPCES